MSQIYGDRWVDVTVDLPRLEGEGVVTVVAPNSVRLHTPRVVVDGDDLAVIVEQTESETRVVAGPVSGATLVLPVRANVPVREREMTLRVRASGETLIVPLSLVGAVRLLPARNQWDLPRSFTLGRSSECKLHLRNDGTVPLEQAVVRVPIQAGVLICGEDARELRAHQRIAVVRFGSLDVGEAKDVVLTVTPLDPGVSQIALVADVQGQGFQATFASDVVSVEPPGQVRLLVERVDKRVARVGDVVRFVARIENGGATSRSAELRVEGDGVAPLMYPLGTFYAGESRDIPVPVTVMRAGVSEWSESVAFGLYDERGRLAHSQYEIACVGEPVLVAGAVIGAADDTLAHAVAVRIDNFGDGQAANVRLRARRIGDVKAVVDSLRVDGSAIYSVDGAVPLFDDGLDLGMIEIGDAREVQLLLRSAQGVRDTLVFSVADEHGSEASATVAVDLQPSAMRQRGSVSDDALVLRAPLPAHFGSVAHSFEALEAHLQSPSVQTPQEPEQVAEVIEPDITYPEQVDQAAVRFIGDGNVEFGRHVLALFSWLPISARDERLRSAIDALRTEAQVVQLQYLPGVSAGMFGISGYVFAPKSLLATLEQYHEVQGGEFAAPADQIAAVRCILDVTSVPQALIPWRSAIIQALSTIQDVEDFGEVFAFEVPIESEVAA